MSFGAIVLKLIQLNICVMFQLSYLWPLLSRKSRSMDLFFFLHYSVTVAGILTEAACLRSTIPWCHMHIAHFFMQLLHAHSARKMSPHDVTMCLSQTDSLGVAQAVFLYPIIWSAYCRNIHCWINTCSTITATRYRSSLSRCRPRGNTMTTRVILQLGLCP